MPHPSKPEKIAILGGGPAALAAAFELTSQPGWKDRYEITLYQLGWRLGGKCATGHGVNSRIEEHGWHIWMGFYENAFNLMRRCYDELDRKPAEAFATWQDAFKPHTFLVGEECFNGQWIHRPTDLPTNRELPGEGTELEPLWTYLSMAIESICHQFMVHEQKGIFATA